jgi:hypothetical protein
MKLLLDIQTLDILVILLAHL